VTSGYCPRYRYTLIAMLTLGNLYYICVDFLPTHTIGESVLPAHFLRVIRRTFRAFHSCRSFHVDRLFGPRSCGSHSLDHSLGHIHVRHSFAGVIRWVHSFSCGSLFGSAFRAGFVRWLFVWASLPSLLLLGSFMWVLGFEVKTLGGEFLKGIFAL
jgi:hypothetical protein